MNICHDLWAGTVEVDGKPLGADGRALYFEMLEVEGEIRRLEKKRDGVVEEIRKAAGIPKPKQVEWPVDRE